MSSNSSDDCHTFLIDGVLGFFVDLFIVLYTFYAVSTICVYLMQSLYVVCEKLNMSYDVAGATFMAAGTSCPELFTAILDVFYTHNDIGTGTVVGSVNFNLFCMIGGSALIAAGPLVLDWRPLARDMAFYALTTIVFSVCIADLVVHWYESLLLIALYIVYIIFMKYNKKYFELADRWTPWVLQNLTRRHVAPQEQATQGLATNRHSDPEETSTAPIELEEMTDIDLIEEIKEPPEPQQQSKLEEVKKPLKLPEASLSRLIHVIVFPATFAFWLSVPDLNTWSHKWWPVTFTMSIGWITVLIYFMVEAATSVGCFLGLKPVIIGLTVLAVGTSFPDFISSLYSARRGYGDMAIANTFGSNIFDVLIGLGLPWIAKSIIYAGEPVILHEKDVSDQIVTMAIAYGLTLVLLWRLELNRKIGSILVSLYVFYVIFLILHTYQIIDF